MSCRNRTTVLEISLMMRKQSHLYVSKHDSSLGTRKKLLFLLILSTETGQFLQKQSYGAIDVHSLLLLHFSSSARVSIRYARAGPYADEGGHRRTYVIKIHTIHSVFELFFQ